MRLISSRRGGRLAALAAATILAALAVACGEEATPAPAAGANNVVVEAADYTFNIVQPFAAGTNQITFTNNGQEEHELTMARLDGGHTVADLAAAFEGGPIPDWVVFTGGIWTIAPGATQTGRTDLQAGPHILLCFVGDAEGVPHFARGMISTFEVTGDTAPLAEPAAGITVTAVDYSFQGAETMPSGKQTVAFKNTGAEPHFWGLIAVPEGMTFEQFGEAMASEGPPPEGAPMPVSAGGVNGLSPGLTAWVDLDLAPGLYAQVCFIPNAEGTPHAFLGMFQPLRVE